MNYLDKEYLVAQPFTVIMNLSKEVDIVLNYLKYPKIPHFTTKNYTEEIKPTRF